MNVSLRRLQTSENGRFLITEDGAPFFWLGDTAWELFHRLRVEEIDNYFRNRKDKQFTLIQAVALAEFNGLDTPNVYGNQPLKDNNPETPDEAYWKFVDEVIIRAASTGLYIGLLPTWGDKVADLWGNGPRIFNEGNAFTYGSWLGKRYRDYPNIVWILGGDRPVTYTGSTNQQEKNDLAIWRSMANGIRTGINHCAVMTYHPWGGHSSSEYIHQEEWLDINMMQSGHGSGRDVPVWEMVRKDYELIPAKPTLDGEPNYEDHPVNPWPKWDPATGYFNDYDVRKQVYRSVFAGGCGVTYGHHSVWQFTSAEREPINHAMMDWVRALDRPGATQVQYLRKLIESRPFLDRIPDQTLLVEKQSEGSSYCVATRDSRGTYAMIYLPKAQEVTVDLGLLDAGQANAWWFNPQTGASLLDGKYSTGTRQTFNPPGGGMDWVLILDTIRPGNSI